MIRFSNFQMVNNCFTIPYVHCQAFDLTNNIIVPQHYQPQPYFQFGIQYRPEILRMPQQFFSSTNNFIQSNSTLNLNYKQTNENTPQFSKQIKEKQNMNQLNMTVPRMKFIAKKSKLKYLKKNTQSNISNQVLAFLIDEKKSQRWLFNFCKKQNLNQKSFTQKFYQWMKIIKTRTKKYISKKVLLNISIAFSDHILRKQFQDSNIVVPETQFQFFCKATRILIKIFLTHYSTLTVLTSKKIHREGIAEHLMRRRQIKNYLDQQYLKV